MNEIFREYEDCDYLQCESLVNQAWKFDDIFAPDKLSNLIKYIYTKGSIVSSNYKMVIEVDGKVVGFIFGFNELAKKPSKNILFSLNVSWRSIWVKTEKPVDKNELVNAMNTHEKNKAKIVGKRKSEIMLFVIDEKYQRKGYGKKLWLGFKDYCQNSGVNTIIVETNKLGASRFYEKLGFTHLANFDSPAHEFAMKAGQACMYKYIFN